MLEHDLGLDKDCSDEEPSYDEKFEEQYSQDLCCLRAMKPVIGEHQNCQVMR